MHFSLNVGALLVGSDKAILWKMHLKKKRKKQSNVCKGNEILLKIRKTKFVIIKTRNKPRKVYYIEE